MRLSAAYTAVLAVLLCLVGCSSHEGGAGRTSLWNAETGRLEVPDAAIGFTMPGEGKGWIVADLKDLPDDIIFAGVDTASQTCVMFLRPKAAGPVDEMPDSAVSRITRRIIGQQNGVSADSVELSRGSVAGRGYAGFGARVEAGAPGQSVVVDFRGYLFDGSGDGRVYGVVLTQPGERSAAEADSVASEIYKGIEALHQ